MPPENGRNGNGFENPTTEEVAPRRQRIGLVAGPLVGVGLALLPPPEGLDPAAWRAAAAGLWMATWWMTEAVPIAVTSLLPLVIFPPLGIAAIDDAAAPYANPLIFLFLGGFLIALAMEETGLHRRLALAVIARAGTSPRRLVAGFMAAAALLSMWISNTATAMMMLPIGLSVVELARRGRASTGAGGQTSGDHEGRNFALCLLLGIAYACSLGGMATLVGTPTNALLVAFLAETYGYSIAFAHWLAAALPLTVVGLVLVHILLTRRIYPIRIAEIPGGRALIDAERAALGAPSRGEKRVALVFVATAALWIGRPLLGDLVPGLSDPGIAMAAALVLFAVPLDWRRHCFVLGWEASVRLPWGVLLLFGGGLSLASAVQRTGLAEWIGDRLRGLDSWSTPLLVLVVVSVIVLLTELTSNTATAAAFLPVLASIAIGLGRDPLLLLVPATLAASCAFMLPVATPPNAIVYGSGAVTVPQMARAGAWLNALFVLMLTAFAWLLLPAFLGVDLDGLPAWAAVP